MSKFKFTIAFFVALAVFGLASMAGGGTQAVFAHGPGASGEANCENLDGGTGAPAAGSTAENDGDVATITATGDGLIITEICIKSGEGSFPPHDDADGNLNHSEIITEDGVYGIGDCYTVEGMGTELVTVTRTDSSACHGISHVSYTVCDTTDEDSECFVEAPAAVLDVSKSADTSFDRDCTWDVTKQVVEDPEAEPIVEADTDVILDGGGSHTFDYLISVSAECEDTNHSVSGEITVTNIGDVEATGVVVTDVITIGDDDFDVAVDCPDDFTGTLAPLGEEGNSVVCIYSFATDEDGSNQAFAAGVFGDDDEDVTGESNEVSFSFDDAEITFGDRCVDVIDTVEGEDDVELGTVCVDEDGSEASETFTYELTIEIDACESVSRTNVVVLINEDEVEIDEAEVTVSVTDPCFGCTPGFWKNHTDIWDDSGDDVSPSYDPDDSFGSAIGAAGTLPAQGKLPAVNLDDLTMEEALELQGGGIRAMVRHAAAALLNADSLGSEYPYDEGQIQDFFADALDGDLSGLALLVAANELGCGFDAHGNDLTDGD